MDISIVVILCRITYSEVHIVALMRYTVVLLAAFEHGLTEAIRTVTKNYLKHRSVKMKVKILNKILF